MIEDRPDRASSPGDAESSADPAPLIVTIDGPAGSGKSTVSLLVARRLGVPYLNSGAIYRAVTLALIDAGGVFDDPEAVRRVVDGLRFEMRSSDSGVEYLLDGRDVTARIKDPDVTSQVYRIANVPEYRALLVDQQRRFARGAGVVAEGRDMGTVIFPEARLKVFLDAPAEARAGRQHRELVARGVESSYEDVLAKLKERDHRDRNREVGPLAPASDAQFIDSGELGIDAVVALVVEALRSELDEGERRRYLGE